MSLVWQFAPLLAAMAVLAVGSAFFSCSEAALFSLQADDRRRLATGNAAQRLAAELLATPNRLLTAILFWNLIINIAYFALASLVGLQLQRQQRPAEAGVMTLASLLAIILLSEMLPKTVGVLAPQVMASFISLPLAVAVRAVGPAIPLFTAVSEALRRILLPNLKSEPYLELSDLERAITLSSADRELVEQERLALHNIVSLSDLRAEELMRPRRQYQSFAPPVSLDDLGGRLTRSGYLLVTDADSDEIAAAIPLKLLPTVPRNHLEKFARPVSYVPWCATVAAVFEQLQLHEREVAAVVNELGETIGIVTLEDVLETIFQDQSSRSARLLERSSVQTIDGGWRVTGMTSLRRLSRALEVELPASKSTTVGGVINEVLQRLPEEGDTLEWGGFSLRVVEATDEGPVSIDMCRLDPQEPTL